MNEHNDRLDAMVYSYVFMPTIPTNYRPIITHANIDVEPKTYKTLIPIKKKRKNKSSKLFIIYLLKTGKRNRMKLKGRNRQIHRWRYEICDCRFNGIRGEYEQTQ